MRKQPVYKKISILVNVNKEIINSYFNVNDPAPMYKRQLSPDFAEYIQIYAFGSKDYSSIQFRFNCASAEDKQYVDPLMHAIRRHFASNKSTKEKELLKFRQHSYRLLGFALLIGALCHAVLRRFFSADGHGFESVITNSIDVLSWVTLWRPVDQLFFQQSGYKGEIKTLWKIVNSEVTLSGDTKIIPMDSLKKTAGS